MVRYSNDRDWHKIESEYRRQFGIRMLTVHTGHICVRFSNGKNKMATIQKPNQK
jgi:hypothetical protein